MLALVHHPLNCRYLVETTTAIEYPLVFLEIKNSSLENQDGGVGRHTAPPRTTRTDRESNSKGDQHQGNRK